MTILPCDEVFAAGFVTFVLKSERKIMLRKEKNSEMELHGDAEKGLL